MIISVSPDGPVSSVVTKVSEELRYQCVDPEVANDCYVIIDEFHANMREHVAPGLDHFKWTLNIVAQKQGVIMTFDYPGPCFDPTQNSDIAYQPIESRRIGGLGLLIMASLSDDISYSYHNGINTLVVRRYKKEIDISQEDNPCL
ncbi:ATP-binding protein [Marinobacter sp. ANT_B65]|uniref:ATP-binding protein n=1 Tax=Marinobacter sp. ANT_B65 TaxID=2039467 RepID=UPI000BBEF267|nr:ATP-binding protein [Marinobacter sp. ANT_B65]PCM44268.1 hypothetical protein CPA50_12205 [Marinobacter sp. ANT_B65]